MKIYTTWSDEFKAFQRFFRGHEVERLPKNYKGIECDLLLFPGGEDIHPKRYCQKLPESSMYLGWINEERDTWEFNVITDVFQEKFNPKKILGICRGMQFLNVAFGGTLYYDIAMRFGRPHPNVHEINWQMNTVFSSIKNVNSIHHEAIRNFGETSSSIILGVEPRTSIIEAALWRDRFLGMQFHPELWGDESEMRVLSSGILNWVEGKDIIINSEPKPVRKLRTSRKSDSQYETPSNISSTYTFTSNKIDWNEPTIPSNVPPHPGFHGFFDETEENEEEEE